MLSRNPGDDLIDSTHSNKYLKPIVASTNFVLRGLSLSTAEYLMDHYQMSCFVSTFTYLTHFGFAHSSIVAPNADASQIVGDAEEPDVNIPSSKPLIQLATTVIGLIQVCPTLFCNIEISFLARRLEPIDIANRISLPQFPQLLSSYLQKDVVPHASSAAKLRLQQFSSLQLDIHPSAVATFHAPSDGSGTAGMCRKRIRAVDSWMGGPGRYDTVFIKENPDAVTVSGGLSVGRVKLLFSLALPGEVLECALIHHFGVLGTKADEDMGMWTVRPLLRQLRPKLSVIPLQKIFRAAHLIPVYSAERVPYKFSPAQTLDHYKKFYINKFVDIHAFKIAT